MHDPVLATYVTFVFSAVGGLANWSGGELGDRIGRERTAIAMMAVSGTCAASIGLLTTAPWWLLTGVSLVWGYEAAWLQLVVANELLAVTAARTAETALSAAPKSLRLVHRPSWRAARFGRARRLLDRVILDLWASALGYHPRRGVGLGFVSLLGPAGRRRVDGG